eukprot:g5898.t1
MEATAAQKALYGDALAAQLVQSRQEEAVKAEHRAKDAAKKAAEPAMTEEEAKEAQARKEEEAKEAQARKETEEILGLDLGLLDITTDNIDLAEVGADLTKFQQDEIVKVALSQGVDLRTYSRQIDAELAESEAIVLQEYLEEGDSLADLHNQVQKCDAILQTMLSMLSRFQSDLGNISAEIRTLQDQSMSMNIKLKNRAAAEVQLSTFVQGLFVSDDLVNLIVGGKVDAAYIKALKQLHEKILFVEQEGTLETRAGTEVAPTVDRLKRKALARCRAFLLERFHALRKPKTNVQIKQKLLLKVQYVYQFLVEHGNSMRDSPELAHEIRQDYVHTMGAMYLTLFKQYLVNMKKLQDMTPKMEKGDLLASDASKTGGLFAAKRTDQQLLEFFSLGDRLKVLEEKDYIIYHVASKHQDKYCFEKLFGSSQRLLMETATSEYDFITEFFASHGNARASDRSAGATPTSDASPSPSARRERRPSTQRSSAAQSMFVSIFAKTFSLFLENMEDHLFSCQDPVQLLLLIRIICQHNNLMQQQRVHCLDAFFDRLTMLFWPRFKILFDANVESVSKLKASAPRDPNQVHYLTRSLRRLRPEVEKFLTRTASLIKHPKRQLVFLTNNYGHIVSILQAQGLECDERSHFSELMAQQVTLVVEEELTEKFGKLISFLKEAEAVNGVKDPALAETIVRHFAKNWKDGMEQIHTSVQRSFSVEEQGDAKSSHSFEILKQVLVQLLLYYSRFEKLLESNCRGAPFMRELVSSSTLRHEIQKYFFTLNQVAVLYVATRASVGELDFFNINIVKEFTIAKWQRPNMSKPGGEKLFEYDQEHIAVLDTEKPWEKDPKYFNECQVSALASMKMLKHALSGVQEGKKGESGMSLEVMGLLIGKPNGRSIVILDAVPLPIKGENNFVEAGPEISQLQVSLLESMEHRRKEGFIGWYHSHPFDVTTHSNAFLSNTDVQTHTGMQLGLPLWTAIVVDPLRSLAKQKPDLGCFRCFPPSVDSPVGIAPDGSPIVDTASTVQRWGVTHNRYYALQVSHFMSGLGHKYVNIMGSSNLWVRNLSSSSMMEPETRDRLPDRIRKASDQLEQGARSAGGGGYGVPTYSGPRGGANGGNKKLEQAGKAVAEIAVEHCAGSASQIVKDLIFNKPFAGEKQEAKQQAPA